MPHTQGKKGQARAGVCGWRKEVGEGPLVISIPSLLSLQMGWLPVPRLPRLPVSAGAWRLPTLERVGRLPATDAGSAAPAGPPVASRGLLPGAGLRTPQVNQATSVPPAALPALMYHLPLLIKVPTAEIYPWVYEQWAPTCDSQSR